MSEAAISEQVVLELANVESAYGPIRAIRGVSLKVLRGQIATVLGSNGPLISPDSAAELSAVDHL